MATLLEQIQANLDDDTPRLVYADELQSRGDPLGEFIAVQVELAKLGETWRSPATEWMGDALRDVTPDAGVVRKLRVRENALLREHEARWAEAAKQVSFHNGYVFERGFVARVRADGRKPLAGLLDAVPMLDSLELFNLTEQTSFDVPVVAQLRALAINVGGIGALVKTAPRALRKLDLADMRTWQTDVLLDWPALAQVRELDLVLANVDATKLLDVAPQLDLLQLRQSRIGEGGARAIAKHRNAASLRALSLLANRIGDQGATALAKSEMLRGLRALDLRTCTIRDAGARAIGAAFPELRALDLTSNPLGVEGVTALVAGTGLGKLRELCLQQTQLDDDAVTVLAGAPMLAHVRVLSLRANAITDRGARTLAKSAFVANLEAINLYKTQVTAAGKKALTKAIPGVRVTA